MILENFKQKMETPVEISATRRGNTWEYEEYEGCFSRDARKLELRSANVLGALTNGAEVLGYR
jgi:hypothetical protein